MPRLTFVGAPAEGSSLLVSSLLHLKPSTEADRTAPIFV